MPVRIYEISKKLGVENKEVLAKAKELGIAAAKVPSSSLDKITAEFLEQELAKTIQPKVLPAVIPPTVAAPESPPAPQAITIITAPPVVTVTEPPAEVTVAPLAESEGKAELPLAPSKVESVPAVMEAASLPAAASPAPPALPPKPAVPPPPPPPRVGDKVGFIQLGARPAPRSPERAGDRGRERDRQPTRGPAVRPPGGRPDGQRTPVRPTDRGDGEKTAPPKPAAPAAPRIELPADAKVVNIKPPIIVRELADKIGRKPFQVIADLMEIGVFATVNQPIEEPIAKRVCAKHGFRLEAEKRERGGGLVHAPLPKAELDIEDKLTDLKPRAPVVTIMGHVDHGKTTLLDVIRKSDVAAGEAGGITQHIGAYTISVPHPEKKGQMAQITFLDTPGHAAFSSMRARGANVTDIVILVVAANDGVMPQTLEALNHAKAAKVPIIVAVNKCDHPNANAMRVRQQLQEHGLVPDDWGGDTLYVDCSALTKQGVEKLLAAITLQSELLELKANPNRKAKGNVIESGLEPGGPMATVLVRKGTLKISDAIICGPWWGKVRALISEDGQRLKVAGPSVAVKVLGLNGVPEAGQEFSVMEDDKAARDLAGHRAEEARLAGAEARTKVTLENLFATIASTSHKILKIVVKADTQGSVEAIVEALKKIESDKVTLEIIHSAVGTITQYDVSLASASEAVILGFHTRIDNGVSDAAKREGVQIKLYSIIYELIDQVKDAMAGLLDPLLKDVVIGEAEVRKIFELSKGVPVAGCFITSGRVPRGKIRVMRRKNLIYDGVVQSLRRFQDEVNEVRSNMECGIRIEGFGDYQVGDVLEAYGVEKVAQKL
jgi:translation initiation factor IF-2